MSTLNTCTAPPFKDRRTALIVVGILLMVHGVLSACVAALIPVGLLTSQITPPGAAAAPAPDPRGIVIGVVSYLLVAAWFIWLGVGSVLTRRWVRPLALITAWTWLLLGIVTLASFILSAGDMEAMIVASTPSGQTSPAPAVLATILVVAGTIFIVIFSIALPLAMVIFYQSRHVQATLVHYNPQPGWTDRVPVTVLGTSLGLALGAVCMPVGLLYGVMPFFGVLLEGWTATGSMLASALILALLAWGIYRQSAIAWWATVVLSALAAMSTIITFSRVEFIEIYRHMGLSEHDLAMLGQQTMLRGPFVVGSTAVMTVAWLIYLVAIRKHFCPESCKV